MLHTDPACSATAEHTEGVDLEAYREERGMTWAELAEMVGARYPRQARAWAKGIERPDAERQDWIVKVTGGRVSIYAMHLKRLAWERQRPRPIKREQEDGAGVCLPDAGVSTAG